MWNSNLDMRLVNWSNSKHLLTANKLGASLDLSRNFLEPMCYSHKLCVLWCRLEPLPLTFDEDNVEHIYAASFERDSLFLSYESAYKINKLYPFK